MILNFESKSQIYDFDAVSSPEIILYFTSVALVRGFSKNT